MSALRKQSNQELRTRKDLLLAGIRLLKKGRKPTMEEVAEEALVSRATAYRHFQTVDVLLAETAAESSVVSPEQLFANNTSDDPEARIDEAEASLHKAVYENEAQLRVMLANSVMRALEDSSVPVRQNRRGPLIEAALAPARHRFGDAEYQKLCAALAMIFGPESMIVARDVIGIDDKYAREVKSWAVRALVRAALEASAK